MNGLVRRESPFWLLASAVLFLLAIGGVVVESGPTAVVAGLLVAVTLWSRPASRDVTRLVVATVFLLALGVGASVIPTGEGCGIPIIESAQHQMEPTPHVHGPCERGNDRRAFAGAVLVIGAVASAVLARRRTAERGPPGG